jgi:hypothetical protein
LPYSKYKRKYLEANHEEGNCFLHFGDFDSYKIGDGYFPVFGLSNVEANIGVIIEIVYLFVVDLVEGDEEP